MSDSNHYVYEHWRLDKNEPFYVGMGRGRRARELYGRNRHHKNVQAKLARLNLAVDIRFVAKGITRAASIALEIERIAYWRSLGIHLTNLTAGGEGSNNPSAETRELMRQKKVGRKLTDEHKGKIAVKSREYAADPAFIERLSTAIKAANSTPEARDRASRHFKSMVRTPEHCAKIAAAKTGLKQSPEHAAKTRVASLGRTQTPEEIAKRAAANTGKKRTPEFCQRMSDLQSRPDIKEANSLRMRELNSRPDFKEANRLRLVARNVAGKGQKRPRNKTDKLQRNQ